MIRSPSIKQRKKRPSLVLYADGDQTEKRVKFGTKVTEDLEKKIDTAVAEIRPVNHYDYFKLELSRVPQTVHHLVL